MCSRCTSCSCSAAADVAGIGVMEGAGDGDRLWAEHRDKVWGGTCLGRLGTSLLGNGRAKDHAHSIWKDPSVCACVCVKMSEQLLSGES